MPGVIDAADKLRAGIAEFEDFTDYQLEFFLPWQSDLLEFDRACLYYRTGGGKSITALAGLYLRGYDQAVVVAPPITHPAWVEIGRHLGIDVTAISHAKFRMRDYRHSRRMPIIVDEFHQLGGHGGKGWAKFDRMCRSLEASVIICSATPQYNDAERVYCIQHSLDPRTTGDYLTFLYRECNTEQNPYGRTPLVNEFQPFKRFGTAEDYLKALPYVFHLADIHTATLEDIPLREQHVPVEFDQYGLNRRTGRIMASRMEAKHQRKRLNLLDDEGVARPEVYDTLTDLVGQAQTPVLVYCDSSTIAEGVYLAAVETGCVVGLLTGKTTPKSKAMLADKFRAGAIDVLIGTATLATGTDGFDKVCNTLIIVDDTTDDALRKQLMGRILPRGLDSDATDKQFFRLVF